MSNKNTYGYGDGDSYGNGHGYNNGAPPFSRVT